MLDRHGGGGLIFDALVAGYIRRNPLGALLTAAAIVFGVASYVTATLTATFADRAIVTSVLGASLHADLQVTSGAKRLNRSILRRVRDVPGVLEARPVIDGSLVLRTRLGSEVVHVRAIDTLQSFPGSDSLRGYEPGPFAPPGPLEDALIERHGIVLSRALANELGLAPGSTVDAIVGRTPHPLSVVSIVRPRTIGLDANTVLVDIASATTLLGADGTLDRIDVVSGAASLETVLSRVRRVLPRDARADRTGDRIASLERLTNGFRLSTSILASVALALGAVLVANSIGISVLRRRPEIAILRSLGATRPQIARAFIIEGALLGALGGTVGALLGEAFALALSGVGDGASLVESGSQLAGDTVTVVRGIGIGVLLSLVAAVAPAVEAASVLPVTALQIMPPRITRRASRRVTATGIGLTLMSVATAFGSAAGTRLGFAYASAIGVLTGIGLCVPFLLCNAARIAASAAARFPVSGYLAVSRVRANGPRLSLTIVTLVLSVCASVGVATATASFQQTLDTWALNDLPGDLEIRPFGLVDAARTDALRARIARLPGVAQLASAPRDAAFFGNSPASLFVVAKPDVSLASLRRAIITATSPVAVDVRLSRDARAAAEDLFAPSLALGSAIGRASVIIAIFSTVATILALAREQRRDFALLRVLGLSLYPLRRTIVYEALALSAFGAILGVGSGLVLGAMLVLVIDPLVSGYPATFVLPLGTTLGTPVVVVVAALLAASVGARLSSARFALRTLQP